MDSSNNSTAASGMAEQAPKKFIVTYGCSVCDFESTDFYVMKAHLKESKKETTVFKCPGDGCNFKTCTFDQMFNGHIKTCGPYFHWYQTSARNMTAAERMSKMTEEVVKKEPKLVAKAVAPAIADTNIAGDSEASRPEASLKGSLRKTRADAHYQCSICDFEHTELPPMFRHIDQSNRDNTIFCCAGKRCQFRACTADMIIYGHTKHCEALNAWRISGLATHGRMNGDPWLDFEDPMCRAALGKAKVFLKGTTREVYRDGSVARVQDLRPFSFTEERIFDGPEFPASQASSNTSNTASLAVAEAHLAPESGRVSQPNVMAGQKRGREEEPQHANKASKRFWVQDHLGEIASSAQFFAAVLKIKMLPHKALLFDIRQKNRLSQDSRGAYSYTLKKMLAKLEAQKDAQKTAQPAKFTSTYKALSQGPHRMTCGGCGVVTEAGETVAHGPGCPSDMRTALSQGFR